MQVKSLLLFALIFVSCRKSGTTKHVLEILIEGKRIQVDMGDGDTAGVFIFSAQHQINIIFHMIADRMHNINIKMMKKMAIISSNRM